MYHAERQLGFTLVEALIVIAISVIVFGALFLTAQYTLHVTQNSKAKLSALSLANDRMEYFRSLSYDNVGTVSGIPAGLIPQHSTTTLNGITFTERVLVEYVDDPADGQLTATTTDANGIPSDYKRIKIEIGWTVHNVADSISLVSNIVPRSIESTAGGGTIRVNVLDADSTSLAGAAVQLVNNTTTSTIDITRYSDLSGTVLFSGAPAASNYEVFVSAPGYSSAQTHEATTSNPIPNTVPFTVLESDISTVTFQIGELSDIVLNTYSDITFVSVEESFSDSSGIATSTDVVVSGDAVILDGGAGSYLSTGKVFLSQIEPTSLAAWGAAVVIVDAPVNTDYYVQFYTGTTSTYTLVDNTDLPGNSVGFTDRIIDLSGLDIASYPDLTVAVTLESSDSAVTPSVEDVGVYYRESETIRASVNFDVTGSKTIGAELDSTPIYKVAFSTSTNASGERTIFDIEFDTYDFDNTDGFLLAYACPSMPFVLDAGVTSTLDMILVGALSNSVRVSVSSDSGSPLPGSSVTLSRPGFSSTKITDACGQVFFDSGVTANPDYTLDVSRVGYDSETVDPIEIDDNIEFSVVLSEV